MDQDVIDEVIKQWRRERPDLDPTPLAVVGRILRLSCHFERQTNEALKPFDLPIWGFDLLGTLRRSGEPYTLTPTELMKSAMLSSGAMTNRIDRLETMGLVERKPAPNDRRSLHVVLTPKGLELINQAAAVRFEEARDRLSNLTAEDQHHLATLLKKILLSVESPDL